MIVLTEVQDIAVLMSMGRDGADLADFYPAEAQ